jgi:hypothetical protein
MTTALSIEEIALLRQMAENELAYNHSGDNVCDEVSRCPMEHFEHSDNEYIWERQSLLKKLNQMFQEASGC